MYPRRHILATWALLVSFRVTAEPFIPTSDTDILADAAVAGADSASARGLRAALQRDPRDVRAAHALSRLYLREARYSGDARFVAYAQATLAPWWEQVSPEPDLRFARAEVKAALHDFAGAVADLDLVIAATPQRADARLLRATLLQLRGEFEAAHQDCVLLAQDLDPLTGILCLASGAVKEGEIARASDVLRRARTQILEREASYRQWFHAVAAELAARSGDWVQAQQYLEAAAQEGPLDIATRALQADVLLQQRRHADVLKAIPETAPADALLVRKIEALRALDHADLATAERMAKRRLDEAALRATPGHGRELALLALLFSGDMHSVVASAQDNWRLQREAVDTRVLLRSARRAGREDVVYEVTQWIKQTGFYDYQTQQLLNAGEGVS